MLVLIQVDLHDSKFKGLGTSLYSEISCLRYWQYHYSSAERVLHCRSHVVQAQVASLLTLLYHYDLPGWTLPFVFAIIRTKGLTRGLEPCRSCQPNFRLARAWNKSMHVTLLITISICHRAAFVPILHRALRIPWWEIRLPEHLIWETLLMTFSQKGLKSMSRRSLGLDYCSPRNSRVPWKCCKVHHALYKDVGSVASSGRSDEERLCEASCSNCFIKIC